MSENRVGIASPAHTIAISCTSEKARPPHMPNYDDDYDFMPDNLQDAIADMQAELPLGNTLETISASFVTKLNGEFVQEYVGMRFPYDSTGSTLHVFADELVCEEPTPDGKVFRLVVTNRYPIDNDELREAVSKQGNMPIEDIPDHLPGGYVCIVPRMTDTQASAPSHAGEEHPLVEVVMADDHGETVTLLPLADIVAQSIAEVFDHAGIGDTMASNAMAIATSVSMLKTQRAEAAIASDLGSRHLLPMLSDGAKNRRDDAGNLLCLLVSDRELTGKGGLGTVKYDHTDLMEAADELIVNDAFALIHDRHDGTSILVEATLMDGFVRKNSKKLARRGIEADRAYYVGVTLDDADDSDGFDVDAEVPYVLAGIVLIRGDGDGEPVASDVDVIMDMTNRVLGAGNPKGQMSSPSFVNALMPAMADTLMEGEYAQFSATSFMGETWDHRGLMCVPAPCDIVHFREGDEMSTKLFDEGSILTVKGNIENIPLVHGVRDAMPDEMGMFDCLVNGGRDFLWKAKITDERHPMYSEDPKRGYWEVTVTSGPAMLAMMGDVLGTDTIRKYDDCFHAYVAAVNRPTLHPEAGDSQEDVLAELEDGPYAYAEDRDIRSAMSIDLVVKKDEGFDWSPLSVLSLLFSELSDFREAAKYHCVRLDDCLGCDNDACNVPYRGMTTEEVWDDFDAKMDEVEANDGKRSNEGGNE